ncbi:MAG: hypothetical protein F6J96_02360 [Symploca sp. SIO1C2]|nr:hypothetical protein [Symploca sp. SIO1C2]
MGNFLTTTTRGTPFSYSQGRRQQAGGRRQKAGGRRQEAEGRRQKAVTMKKNFHHQVMKVGSSLFPLAYFQVRKKESLINKLFNLFSLWVISTPAALVNFTD